MKKITTELPKILLVGITARTNNAAEMNPATAKIGATMQRFFAENLPTKIAHHKNRERIFSVYTNYASDFTGDYTYFIGQEVTSLDNVDANLETITIPAQSYAKFTSAPGVIPNVVINMWQRIWQMTPIDLGGDRAYQADFEIYDNRSMNPQNAIVDIYIGTKK